MKPSELRIGNWIHNDYFGDSWDAQLTIEEVGACYHRTDKMLSPSIKPIPLTEEWLEKFGFEKMANREWFKQGSIQYNPSREILEIWQRDNWITYKKQFKYVHQLQNLYFALTNEELTIKQLTT